MRHMVPYPTELLRSSTHRWICSESSCTWTLPDVASAAKIYERHICDEGGRFDDEEIDKYGRVPHAG